MCVGRFNRLLLVLLLCHCAPFAAAEVPKDTEPSHAPRLPESHRCDIKDLPRYRKWLNEDVLYIITDRERGAFLKICDDRQRDAFVETFWARRDPTPGTPENEFKEEHYRRVAYANEHFAAGVPGWKTDRGRVYIIYGPPDKIESHTGDQKPSSDSPNPSEVWIYRRIQNVGHNVRWEFVDTCRCGKYRLKADPTTIEPFDLPQTNYW